MEEKSNGGVKEDLEKIVQEIVEKMGFFCEVSVTVPDADSQKNYICNIKTEESNFLIGQHGANLDSLQHIVRLVARRKNLEKIDFIVDVNFYKREKNDSIMNLARNLADQAAQERRAVVMRPMSAYERRLVHLALSQEEKVKTESIGEGEDRRIVIKPADLI